VPNRQVAERLFLSPKTVEYHLSHIYRKLIRSYEIAALSMKLAPGESPADVKPAGSSPIATCSAASRMTTFRTYRRPDWAVAAFSSARYSIGVRYGRSTGLRRVDLLGQPRRRWPLGSVSGIGFLDFPRIDQ
jgi:regulatory LuxR family protein